MCIICKLFDSGKLTIREAKAASWELVETDGIDIKHLQEVYGKMEELEQDSRGNK